MIFFSSVVTDFAQKKKTAAIFDLGYENIFVVPTNIFLIILREMDPYE